jgi:WD40 repeat protein
MSQDGRWVAAIVKRGIDIFDAGDWTSRPLHLATAAVPTAVAVSRSALALLLSGGSLEIRALPSLRVIGRLSASSRLAAPLAISPNGADIAGADSTDPRRAVIYSFAAKAGARTVLPTQPESITTLRFAPDGSVVAVGSGSGSLAVYRPSDGTLVDTLAGHDGPLMSVAWTGTSAPTGLYSVGLDGQLISWDLRGGPLTVHEAGPDHVPAINPSAQFGSLVAGYAQPPNTPDSKILAYTLDLRTGRYASWPAGLRDDDASGQIVASTDGRLGLVSILDSSGNNRIEIVDLRTHSTVGHLALPPGTAHFPDGLEAAASPDGRYAVCSLGRTRIGVFALPSGRYLHSFTVQFADPDSARIDAMPAVFDPAGRLVMGSYDPGPNGPEPWAKSGPALPSNQRLGLVDVSSGRLVAQTGLGDIGFPAAVAWSHDKRTLALGTSAGTLGLYDARTLQPGVNVGRVSSGFLNTASFAPDDRTLVTADSAGSIDFWSVPDLTREGSRIAIGNAAATNGLGGTWAWYRPDGDIVGLAEDEARPTAGVRWFVFDARPAVLANIACRLAGADITRVQWRQFIGDRPYQHVCG